MAVMKSSSINSQFPQTAEWTQWLCDVLWPHLDAWAVLLCNGNC